MAEKELVKSGIPEMDAAIPIAMGDNLVWQVSNLDEFRLFPGPFIEQAIRDGRKIIYVRFASHPPLVHERKEVKRVTIPLSKRFESFTVDIHNLISREGPDVFYIFDCLSELQTAWATDLMMGTFFRLTCPYLYQMNTVPISQSCGGATLLRPWGKSGIRRSCFSTSTPMRIWSLSGH